MCFTGFRKYSHKLLVGLEWCAKLEWNVELIQAHKVYMRKSGNKLVFETRY